MSRLHIYFCLIYFLIGLWISLCNLLYGLYNHYFELIRNLIHKTRDLLHQSVNTAFISSLKTIIKVAEKRDTINPPFIQRPLNASKTTKLLDKMDWKFDNMQYNTLISSKYSKALKYEFHLLFVNNMHVGSVMSEYWGRRCVPWEE